MTDHDDGRWRKSSCSGASTDCVELHPDGAVRDSKSPAGPTLRFGDYAAVRMLVEVAHLVSK